MAARAQSEREPERSAGRKSPWRPQFAGERRSGFRIRSVSSGRDGPPLRSGSVSPVQCPTEASTRDTLLASWIGLEISQKVK